MPLPIYAPHDDDGLIDICILYQSADTADIHGYSMCAPRVRLRHWA